MNRFRRAAALRRGPLLALAIALASAPGAAAQDMRFATSEVQSHQAHEVTIGGQKLRYEVTAGRLPIRELEAGEVHGRMFYTAFTAPSRDGKPRPVLFVWGGGPSGPSVGMQMHYGPATIDENGAIVGNPATLLAVADLVFVDPIGTGFSRPEKAEYGKEFYSTNGDGRSLAEFVRVWLALNGREDAPLFLTGQSFGVWRTAIVAQTLEQRGRRVAGVMLTSGGMGIADDYSNRALDVALRVPDYAAAALFHGRLAADKGATLETVRAGAEQWARTRFAPALEAIATLSDADREAIAAELAAWTGYPLAKIDRKKLSFTPREYLRDFPGVEGQSLNTFDMRVITGRGPGASDPAADGKRNRAYSRYLRDFIGYRTDLAYLGQEDGYMPVTGPDFRDIGSRWGWDSSLKGQEAADMASAAAGEGPPGKQPWILRAIEANPNMRVFVESAIYDSLNYCLASDARKQAMPADLTDNFELHCYPGGHGSFRNPKVFPKVMADLRDFIARTAR